jgi:hypothetical protein
MSGKLELNAVLAKSKHSQDNKSENKSVLGNENGACLSPKQTCWDPTIYYSKQKKRKLKTKIKTLQEQHISYEAIKI